MNIFIIQLVVILLLLGVMIYLLIYNKSLKLEKRLSKYSIDSIKSNNHSVFDMVYETYNKLIKNMSKKLLKSKAIKDYANKYNKYISYYDKKNITSMDYVSNKIYISLAFVLITIFAGIIMGKVPSLISIITALLLGFFIIDIYFKFFDIIKKRQVEQELLNAIIIMNNAFRSGRSTMQAIEIVSKELKGPIKQEFKKMHLEISYGLSLDVVFDRFSKRVESDEVSYITSSLSILNKTGGNIINVFASIEKMLFEKRKLKQEMKALTSSSKMVSKILLFMPVIFIFLITLLNRTYFIPLFTTTIGNIMLVIIVLMYFLYAFIVTKIMKVRI